jgi:hypothetical protein
MYVTSIESTRFLETETRNACQHILLRMNVAMVHRRQRLCIPRIFFLVFVVSSAHGFLPLSTNQKCRTLLNLVTEDDVIQKVEEAEALWTKAHDARERANALSDQASEEAEAASGKAIEVERKMKEGSVSMEKLQEADAATMANIEANSMVSKALQAAEEADLLEEMAEQALQESEKALTQHLEDFPDSQFAE